MFRHRGEKRTLKHNLRIASLLSFVAGMVNVAGFLAVQRLTTNVTGHFAFLIEQVLLLDAGKALVYTLYIFSFFLGSFTSSILVEAVYKKHSEYLYSIPAIFEVVILLVIGTFGYSLTSAADLIACALLFAMGLQNSLVTKISNAAVRTTHLTGLFTDLGIELSQLIFYKEEDQRKKLFSSIKLRFTIIAFFFIGGVAGGLIYSYLHLSVMNVAGGILAGGMLLDYAKVRRTPDNQIDSQ